MAIGAGWLFILSRRQRGLLGDIEADLDRTVAAHDEPRAATVTPPVLGLAADAEA